MKQSKKARSEAVKAPGLADFRSTEAALLYSLTRLVAIETNWQPGGSLDYATTRATELLEAFVAEQLAQASSGARGQ